MTDSNHRHIAIYSVICLSFLVFALFNIIVFLNIHGLYSINDIIFHLRRVTELKEAIMHHNFFPSISFNYFHGSAVMGMYPYISLYPFAFILMIFHSVIYSFYIFLWLISYIMLLVSFLSCLKWSKSLTISYIFAVFYSTSSSVILQMFTNGDLGLLTSSIFLPMVIFGYIELLNESSNYITLALGVILMFFCQLPATCITILFLILWSLINIKNWSSKFIVNILKATLLTALCTAIIWLPLLHVLIYNHIFTVSNVYLTGAPIRLFVKGISIVPILAILLSIFKFKHLTTINRQMLYLSIFFIFISSKLMPWSYINHLPIISILNNFQYAQRFLIIPQLLLSYLFAVIVSEYLKTTNKRKIMMTLLIFSVIFLQISIQMFALHKKEAMNPISINNYHAIKYYELNKSVENNHGFFIRNNKSMRYIINGYTHNHDYYPTNSLHNMNHVLNNQATYSHKQSIRLHHQGYNQFDFLTHRTINHLSLPLVYYTGEHLHVYLNNHMVKYHTNKQHLITINHIKRGSNELKVKGVPNKYLALVMYLLPLFGFIWMITSKIKLKSHKS